MEAGKDMEKNNPIYGWDSIIPLIITKMII